MMVTVWPSGPIWLAVRLVADWPGRATVLVVSAVRLPRSKTTVPLLKAWPVL